jgi:2-polyprenyl-6-methoxyphenol hydroxylase-like FAD-dependent oxidoreductase
MKVLIVGGGIGGLATALSLDAVGIACEVFEKSPDIRELGVGINILPHAVKQLAELGLLDALDRVGIRTHELIYANRLGQEIWREPRGVEAGYDYPQLSIHRGKLQALLYRAARLRIGADNIHTGHQLRDFAQDGDGVSATFATRDGAAGAVTVRGDVLIAADGIHSTVRRIFYQDEGPPAWNGMMMWRGTVPHEPFLTGASMIIAGGMGAKLVLFPISNNAATPDANLLNWVVVARLGDGSTPPPRREDWGRLGRPADVMPYVERTFRLSVLDPVEVVRATPELYEYPMCDRDPLPRWSFGRVTLLGDAAHPMYPVGSNGASQAIIDARCVASLLAEADDVATALNTYEAVRLPATANIVQSNRSGGSERVIDVIEERAPGGFSNLEDVVRPSELEAILQGYASMAGFNQAQVNGSL